MTEQEQKYVDELLRQLNEEQLKALVAAWEKLVADQKGVAK